ncbi:tetratricopeptide repeat protein [Sphingomonas sp. IW22]|uniref:tetratricopeptide repeat protein n=1 Tax=Sphingomonas sp. IW22 TaxID=3242489 RepID=UPI00352102AA
MLAQAAANPEIIVRARRTEDALTECIERQCPTPDDARLSIAHAEAQFEQGQYFEARDTLNAALSRQSGAAARFPRSVAALYEANATINRHMGDMDRYRSMTTGQSRTLKENLPADDPQVLANAIHLGDFWMQMDQPSSARAQFDAATKGFSRRGNHQLAALTQLRAAAIDIQQDSLGSAERRLDAAINSPAADDPTVRQFAAVLRAKLARARGNEGAVDALLSTLRTDPDEPPVLIHDVPVINADAVGAANAIKRRMGDLPIPTYVTASLQIQWADIGFMIRPNGQVAEVEVLRGSRSRGWTTPFLEAMRQRQYAPLDLPAASPGIYRVERLTWRPERIVATGSNIKVPAGAQGIEIIDITNDRTAATLPST